MKKRLKDICTVNMNRTTNKYLKQLISKIDIKQFTKSEINKNKNIIQRYFNDSIYPKTCKYIITYFVNINMFDITIINNTPMFDKTHSL